MAAAQCWVALSFGSKQQYAGNLGYDDDPARFYRYDNFVANSKRVKRGDWMLICDTTRVIGIARIESLTATAGTKERLRCPICAKVHLKRRKNTHPAFRCTGGHEFEEPTKAIVPCTVYTASFGSTFTQVDQHVDRTLLRDGCPRYNDQHSIQQFLFDVVRESLRSTAPDFERLLGSKLATGAHIAPEAAAEGQKEDLPESGYLPDSSQPEHSPMRQIRARRGQRTFRDALRRRYGDRCLVTGCELLDVLEAAHICPYNGVTDQHPENGLLLRADIHTLFDLDLLGVEPDSLRIVVHPAAQREYSRYGGQVLLCGHKVPSRAALRERWEGFQRGMEQFQSAEVPVCG